MKVCPQCKEKELDFDRKTGRIYCKRCNYQTYILK